MNKTLMLMIVGFVVGTTCGYQLGAEEDLVLQDVEHHESESSWSHALDHGNANAGRLESPKPSAMDVARRFLDRIHADDARRRARANHPLEQRRAHVASCFSSFDSDLGVSDERLTGLRERVVASSLSASDIEALMLKAGSRLRTALRNHELEISKEFRRVGETPEGQRARITVPEGTSSDVMAEIFKRTAEWGDSNRDLEGIALRRASLCFGGRRLTSYTLLEIDVMHPSPFRDRYDVTLARLKEVRREVIAMLENPEAPR